MDIRARNSRSSQTDKAVRHITHPPFARYASGFRHNPRVSKDAAEAFHPW